MKTTRCSKLDLAEACPASTVEPRLKVESRSEEALIGSAVHEWLRLKIDGDEIDPLEVAHEFDVEDTDEVDRLCSRGWFAWCQVRQFFPDPQTEVPVEFTLNELHMTGHIDVLSYVDGEARILDFKTGYADSGHWAQLKGYCVGAMKRRLVASGTARACVLRVRDALVDWQSFNAVELGNWLKRLADNLQHEEVYRPGVHCQFCERGLECEAKDALLLQAFRTVTNYPTVLDGTENNRAKIVGMLHDKRKLLETVMKRAAEMERAAVAAAGGTLDLGDGRFLVLSEMEQKRIDFARGQEILVQSIGYDRLASVAKVSKADVEKAVKEVVPRGHGAKAFRQMMQDLEAAGAINYQSSQRLEVRRGIEQADEPKQIEAKG